MNNNSNNVILETPFGDKRPSPEDITNGTKLEGYEKRGIDTTAVRNGTLTFDEFERGIQEQEFKETFLFAGIIIIVILLIAILNKK